MVQQKKGMAGKLAGAVILMSGISLGIAACHSGEKSDNSPVQVKLIALNDFHGNFEIPAENNGGAVTLLDPANPAGTKVRTGGAAYLSSLVQQLKSQNPNTVVVGAGDIISASPFSSAATHDEATIDIMNQIGLEVTSVGNHEFDHGKAELLRQQNGGCFPGGVIGKDTCINGNKFDGAKFKWLAANVVDTASGQSLLPATYVKTFGNVKVGFIGLTLKGTPGVVTSTGVEGLTFLDEASTINKYASQLREQGANAVVVLIHQGGQTTASTLNDHTCPGLTGDIVPIVDALSNDVDVVVSGHTHQEYVCQRHGKLLTSTGFYGSAVTDINLTIQPGGGVIKEEANTVPVINGQLLASDVTAKKTSPYIPAGFAILQPDAAIAQKVQFYVDLTSGLKNNVVGSITTDIKRALLPNSSVVSRDETAEGALGDVMADVYLAGGPKADFAFINPGGIRADLIYHDGGNVTYGDLLTVAPFANTLVTSDLTGTQVVRLLEQQWEQTNCSAKKGINGCGRLLQPSANFSYTWDAAQPSGAPDGMGHRVIVDSIKINGQPIDLNKTYRVTFNSFMAPGPGDNFSVVTQGKNITNSGVIDIDAFVAYMKAHPKLSPPAPRITRLN